MHRGDIESTQLEKQACLDNGSDNPWTGHWIGEGRLGRFGHWTGQTTGKWAGQAGLKFGPDKGPDKAPDKGPDNGLDEAGQVVDRIWTG